MALALAAAEYGAGPPLAILHGLLGSGRNWATMAQRLAVRHRVVAFDLRNHGVSPWAETMGYDEMAEDVRRAMAARGHRGFAAIGHSMGGKVAMTLALSDGAAVERLVVVDIAPVAYPLHHLDLVRQLRRLDLTQIARRRDTDEHLAATIPDAAERAFLLQNLVFEDGKPAWRANLAAIERNMAALADFPARPPETAYRGPALFVAGMASDYVRAGDETTIERLFPRAEITRIDRAGHWLHAERPEAFLDIAGPFLAGR